MYLLNEKTKANISKRTGIDFQKISSLDLEEIDSLIENKIGKKLDYDNVIDKRLTGRGSVYIYLSRLIGKKDINRALSRP